MSYTLSAYLVDLDQLRSAVGSKDERLIRTIMKANPDEFDDADDFDEGAARLPLADALRHLVYGTRLDRREYTQYAYALEEMCRSLGKELPSQEWTAARQACLEATGLDAILTDVGPPVELPAKTGFPSVGYVTPERAVSELARVTALKSSLAAGVDGVLGLLGEYEGWLQAAIRRKRGLVLFYG